MPPLGYTTPARVEQHLGRSFTAAQLAECAALLEPAEQWINGRTGRVWASTTQITERQTVLGRLVYLEQAPVASVASVAVRPQQTVGAASTTLTAGAGYELLDADVGLLLLHSAYAGWLATVTYTPAVPVDSRVALAATKLVGAWLRPVLDGISGDIKSYSIGQELQVTYRDSGGGAGGGAGGGVRGIPDDVLALVDQLLGGAVFA